MGIAAKSDLKALKFTTIETKGSLLPSTALTVEHSYFNSSLLFLSAPFRQNPTEHFKCKIWSAVFPAVPRLPPPPTNDCYLCYDPILLTNSNKFKLWTFSLKLTLLKEITLIALNNIINIDKVLIDLPRP